MDITAQNTQTVYGSLAFRECNCGTAAGKAEMSTSVPALIYCMDKEAVCSEIKKYHDSKIAILSNEIRSIINRDEYIDGEVSQSEVFALETCKNGEIDLLLESLMQIYMSSFSNVHQLEGILTMVSSFPYETVYPKGQIIAVGLLLHKDLLIRDRAIQCFERWDSKKGLRVLKSLNFQPEWLQKYADKVVLYIERDGLE